MNDVSDIRIGVIVPTGNQVHRREFEALAPRGVAFQFAHFDYPAQDALDFCGDLAGNMAQPARELVAWGAKAILIGCTTASMTCANANFLAALEAIAGVPVVTAASAGKAAAEALGLRSVSVATPYGVHNNQVVSDFLADVGIHVAAIQGMDLDISPEVWLAGQPTLTTEKVFEFSCAVDVLESDGLYLPCTGMESLETIALYEAKTGKPAFSSVQAGYWASLRRLGLDGRQTGVGRLLQVWDF